MGSEEEKCSVRVWVGDFEGHKNVIVEVYENEHGDYRPFDLPTVVVTDKKTGQPLMHGWTNSKGEYHRETDAAQIQFAPNPMKLWAKHGKLTKVEHPAHYVVDPETGEALRPVYAGKPVWLPGVRRDTEMDDRPEPF